MKETFSIISDGSCDIPMEEAARLQVEVLPFYVSFQEKVYVKNKKIRKLYQKLVETPGHRVKSAPPRVEDYVNAFLPLAAAGPVLCICMDGTASRSYRHAQRAKREVLRRMPKAQIEVVDSGTQAILQGLLVREAARLRAEGHSFYGVFGILQRLKRRGRLFLMNAQPTYRPAEAKRSMDRCLSQIVRFLKKESPREFTITVGFGYNYGDAAILRSRILRRLRKFGLKTSEEQIRICRTRRIRKGYVGSFPLGAAVLTK